jgi:histidine ammonia-lyase
LLDSASNRRVLPDFLTREGGLNSGFMLTQYTAAALASENKSLVHPASADTIPTSANWEDHVSNGPIAGRKARQIIGNTERIVALELLAAAQGVDFRREACPDAVLGAGTQTAYDMIRSRVPFWERDAVLYPYMNAICELVAGGDLCRAVQPVIADCWQA